MQSLPEITLNNFSKDATNLVYGPAAAGKTLFCILACIKIVNEGKNILYIDTEKGFNIDRFREIAKNDDLLSKVQYIQANSKEHLNQIMQVLPMKAANAGLIVVDSISKFYRLELSVNTDKKEVNNEFGELLKKISEIRRSYDIPIILTSQVYSSMKEDESVEPVGGSLIKNRCKRLIEIKKLAGTLRHIKIIKDPSKIEKEGTFKIEKKGISELNLH